jgi:DNA-binding transcriptional ArsR family regulator
MELRVLNYFLMVTREENITKAAQLLHVTQPTLSRQLMQLEEELGVKLFERSSHSIILTDDGVLLKRRAQELVSLAEKTKQDFFRQDENLIGEIAIGGGELLSIDFFSGVLSSFREKHPLIRYDLYSGNADNVKDYIERGLLQGNSIYFTDEISPQKRYNVNRVMRDENRKIKRKYKRSKRPEKGMGKFAAYFRSHTSNWINFNVMRGKRFQGYGSIGQSKIRVAERLS